MACKTVINRACKLLISSSDDSILYDPLEEDKIIDVTDANVQHEIKTKANKESLYFSQVEEAEVVEPEEVIQNQELEQLNFEEEPSVPNF